jgi:ribosomal protein S18 acetylase RimI-like enzyme
MTAYQIVTLAPDEWQQFRQIRLEALLAEPQAFGSTYDATLQRPDSHWRERLEQVQAGENSWLLFAREGERLIGMTGAFRAEESDTVEIYSVYVAKDRRGLGVGNALMTAILEAVCQPGIFRKAILGVNSNQSAAVALYRRFGFEVVAENTGIMGDGQPALGYVMEKWLP